MVIVGGVEVVILSHLQNPIPITGEGTSPEHSPPLQSESSEQYRPSSHDEESVVVVEVEVKLVVVAGFVVVGGVKVKLEVVVIILSHLQDQPEHSPPLQSES